MACQPMVDRRGLRPVHGASGAIGLCKRLDRSAAESCDEASPSREMRCIAPSKTEFRRDSPMYALIAIGAVVAVFGILNLIDFKRLD